ncbi:uncharacterized protein [Gossypium hirsutum]|uniref:Uncharacterized protein isoform X1 n=1 Tax=Gossypium hirsutum TaxID=3635 RepID=A0ABM2ZSH4_GOSHI|nr:uncharacterized protein LOC107891407 isoform X1 [Gossypium hirsutum]
MASTKKYIYTIDDGCFHAAHLLLLVVSCSSTLGAIGWGLQGATSGMEDAKDQIVQESKNSTLPSQDEKNPFVPGREIPPDAQDQIQRFYHDCGVRAEGHEGTPHEALILALGYLGVRDLFLIENVCTSLRSVFQNDPLLWRDILINPPPNEKITDDVLLQNNWLRPR